MSRLWFISHPSGATEHTPTFFNAVQSFAAQNPAIEILIAHQASDDVKLTRQDIEKSELVLVEVSIPSTGSGIELGWASAAGKPIHAFHQGGTQASPAVKFVTQNIYNYISNDDIIKILQHIQSTA